MKLAINNEALKFAGGTIIVAGAFLIMLPDVVRYLAGLWRLGLFIAAVLAIAGTTAIIIARAKSAAAGKTPAAGLTGGDKSDTRQP